jgi:hypothetical protein
MVAEEWPAVIWRNVEMSASKAAWPYIGGVVWRRNGMEEEIACGKTGVSMKAAASVRRQYSAAGVWRNLMPEGVSQLKAIGYRMWRGGKLSQ